MVMAAVLLFSLGAFLRLFMLDYSAFRADTIEFYKWAGSTQPIIEIWKNPPWADQIPFSETVEMLFHRLFSLDPTHFTVRLPFALMGMATLAVLFFFGRRLRGWLGGLTILALAALNPFHLYTSRESYHYVEAAFFSSMTLLAFWRLWQAVWAKEPMTRRNVLPWMILSVVTCHTHMATWSVFAAQWVVLAVSAHRAYRREPAEWKRAAGWMVACGAAVTLFLSPWIYRALTQYLAEAERRFAHRAGDWSDWIRVVRGLGVSFTFGDWIGGWLLFAAVLAAALWAILRARERRTLYARLGLLTLVEFIFLALVMAVIGKGRASSNYFAPVWPAFMALFGLAVCEIGTAVSVRRSGRAGVVTAVLTLLLAAYWAVPVRAIVLLEGKPTPYKKIVHWLDHTLPPNTPVLVDRWYEPWNEMAVYAPSNAYVTFTIPDEPVDAFVKNRWRETARHFFQQYPQAAFLELTKNHWTQPGVGPWDWPREHFARHEQIINEPGLVLRRWGLAPRGGFYASNTNRLVIDVFYNTREDVLARARERGERAVMLYGETWGNAKPFWQRGDFRHWRVMGDRAELEIYNVTDERLRVGVILRGVSVQGDKRIQSNAGKAIEFPRGKLVTATFGPIEIPPGRTALQLADPSGRGRQIPLLADRAELQVEQKGARDE